MPLSSKQEQEYKFNWEVDPDFYIVEHLTLPRVYFVFRELSPTAYQEIKIELKNNHIHSLVNLTPSERKFIEKNLP